MIPRPIAQAAQVGLLAFLAVLTFGNFAILYSVDAQWLRHLDSIPEGQHNGLLVWQTQAGEPSPFGLPRPTEKTAVLQRIDTLQVLSASAWTASERARVENTVAKSVEKQSLPALRYYTLAADSLRAAPSLLRAVPALSEPRIWIVPGHLGGRAAWQLPSGGSTAFVWAWEGSATLPQHLLETFARLSLPFE